jgi:hypothetical protein
MAPNRLREKLKDVLQKTGVLDTLGQWYRRLKQCPLKLSLKKLSSTIMEFPMVVRFLNTTSISGDS